MKILATLILVSMFVVSPLSAAQLDHQAKLDKAILTFQSADFGTAIDMLTEIHTDKTTRLGVRRKVLWHLAQCHVAQKNYADAYGAVEELLTLEPPKFEPDFEKEPPKLLEIYYEARKQKLGDARVERPDPGVQVLAVVDFKNRSFIKHSEQYDSMEKGFADIMTFATLGVTGLKVVERDRVQWLVDEQGIQNKHEMKGAVRIGQLMGVHVVLLGSFILQNNEELWLNARLVKVETGEILLHEADEGRFKDFLKITRNLSNKISKTIGLKKIYVPREEVPNSLEAHLAYSRGLVLLDQDRYDEAYEKFEEALQLDPGFERAKKAMDRIRSMTHRYARLGRAEK